MKERLDLIQERYNFLCDELLKPEIYEDYKKMQTISKEKNSVEGIVKAYKKYNQVIQDIVAAKEMSHDEEMREFALEELDRLSKTKIELENKDELNQFNKIYIEKIKKIKIINYNKGYTRIPRQYYSYQ